MKFIDILGKGLVCILWKLGNIGVNTCIMNYTFLPWYLHSLFSANYWHNKNQLDPGADGEDKEAAATGWRVWHFQDCHYS